MVWTVPKGKRKGLCQTCHNHCSHSIHITDTPRSLNIQLKYRKCGYNHTKSKWHANGRDIYNCGKKGHFTCLCRIPRWQSSQGQMAPQLQKTSILNRITWLKGTAISWGTGQTAEGTAAGVVEAILVTVQHPETATEPIQRSLQMTQKKQKIQFNPLLHHALPPRQP